MNKLIIIIFICLTKLAAAQTLSPTVIGSKGGYDKTDDVSLEWTLGEVEVNTFSYSSGIQTDGFHQPVLKVVRIESQIVSPVLNVTISPNPVRSILNVKIQSDVDSKLVLKVLDINGKLCYSTMANSLNDSKELDLANLKSGSYLLNIYNGSGSICQTYKISKIQ